MTFNPKEHLIDLQGQDYLPVAWRIVWFREENPSGSIVTDLQHLEPVIVKAVVSDAEGHVLGTGYGTPKTRGKAAARPFEGAETAAIVASYITGCGAVG